MRALNPAETASLQPFDPSTRVPSHNTVSNEGPPLVYSEQPIVQRDSVDPISPITQPFAPVMRAIHSAESTSAQLYNSNTSAPSHNAAVETSPIYA